MRQGRSHGGLSGGDIALVGVAAFVVGAGVLLWLSGDIAAAVLGRGWPGVSVGLAPALTLGVARHLADPALAWPPPVRHVIPGPVAVYGVLGLLLFLVGGPAVWAAGHFAGRKNAGFARRAELRTNLSKHSVRARAPQVRPGLNRRRARPAELGVRLGRDSSGAGELWASLEDSFLILGPPRSGKGVSLVIPGVAAAPGAVVVTSTRPDVLTHTAFTRKGPVEVFDPQGASRWPSRLRWSPIKGCEDPLTAIRRARGFAAGAGYQDTTTNDGYWTGSTAAVIRAYLHAAALGGRSMTDVVGWVSRPADPEPIRLLRSAAGAAPTWADGLADMAKAEPETRDSIWSGVQRAFDCLADPRVLDACSPEPDEAFDAEAFLEDRGALYILGSPDTQISVAPLITALIEDLAEHAQRLAAGSAAGRLDPPLSLWLDEAANIAPLATLPYFLSAGGGSGICTIVVLQSLAQARARWGPDQADAIWDASTVRVVLGGLGHADDLAAISRLAGEIDEEVTTTSTGAGGTGHSTSMRSRPVLPLERLRTLPEFQAVVLHRRTAPVEAVLDPWWDQPCARDVRASLAKSNRRLRKRS